MTGIADAQAAAESLLHAEGSRVEWVVLKQGEEGCYIITRGGEVVHQPAMDVTVDDTVGCGDSLAAAVVMGYTRGYGACHENGLYRKHRLRRLHSLAKCRWP